MKIGCQPVAMTTETDRLLSKDNYLTSPQWNNWKMSTKIIWLLTNAQSRPGSACDQKHIWQETHMIGNASMDQHLALRRRQVRWKHHQENSGSQGK